MAAAHIYSARFTNGVPTVVKKPIGGSYIDSVTLTIPTTTQDDAGDTANFLPVSAGLILRGAHIEVAAMATSNLDWDLILRDPGAALGATPNATLLNAGTLFTAGVSKYFAFATPVTVPNFTAGYGIVGFVCNVAGGTPVEQAITLTIFGG